MKFPSVKPRQVVKALERAGFVKARQTGSHLIMKHPQSGKIVPVPIHAKTLKKGLLMAIVKESGLSKKEFIFALENRRVSLDG